MGTGGGDGPSGLQQRELRTLFLRAPSHDWAALAQGHKTEFRLPQGGFPSKWIHAPTPVVLYVVSVAVQAHELMVLTHHHSESLLDIKDDPGALAREGFKTYDHFRSYWRARTRRPYEPLAKVEVFRLAPWIGWKYRDELGMVLLRRLYGDYL